MRRNNTYSTVFDVTLLHGIPKGYWIRFVSAKPLGCSILWDERSHDGQNETQRSRHYSLARPWKLLAFPNSLKQCKRIAMELNVRRLFRPRHLTAYVQIVCGGIPVRGMSVPLSMLVDLVPMRTKREANTACSAYWHRPEMPVHHPLAKRSTRLDHNGFYFIIASATEHMREELFR